MKKRKLSQSLQLQIRRYLEYLHEEERNGAQRGKHLLGNLTNELLSEVKIESYEKYIRNVKLFQEIKFSKPLINELCLKINEAVYAPGNLISEVN